MKVRVLRSFASREHGSFQQGAVVDMPEAADWVEAGHAEPVGDQTDQPETSSTVGEDLFQTEEAGDSGEQVDVSEYHTGGGWYDVPGSEKKVRKDEAEEILTGAHGREAANG